MSAVVAPGVKYRVKRKEVIDKIAAGFIMANGVTEFAFLACAVIISIVLHEIAHGYAALWNGDPTAKISGRLTINPIKHFDLVGFLMLLVCGFGYAKPVPVNPYNFRHKKRGIFTVAIAGVTVNLLLAFISSGLFVLMAVLQAKYQRGAAAFAGFRLFFSLLMRINLSLFFFNLLPVYPLDGFRVLESFTRYANPVTRFLRDYGAYILIALVGLGIVVDIFNMPYYFDILGTYIIYARNGVIKLFLMIWGVG